MSLRLLHHETRWQPAEYESDNQVRCANCPSAYDFDDQQREFVIIGWTRVEKLSVMGKPYIDSEPVILCIDCKRGFTCDWCEKTLPQPVDKETGLCPECLIKLAVMEAAAERRSA